MSRSTLQTISPLAPLIWTIVLFWPVAAQAQSERGAPPTTPSIGLGIGYGYIDGFGRLALTASVDWRPGPLYIETRITSVADAWGGSDAGGDVAVLVGMATHSGRWAIAGGLGVGLVTITREPPSLSPEPLRVGLPITVMVDYAVSRSVALGLRGIANLNTSEPFGGAIYTVRFLL